MAENRHFSCLSHLVDSPHGGCKCLCTAFTVVEIIEFFGKVSRFVSRFRNAEHPLSVDQGGKGQASRKPQDAATLVPATPLPASLDLRAGDPSQARQMASHERWSGAIVDPGGICPGLLERVPCLAPPHPIPDFTVYNLSASLFSAI